MPLEIRFAIKTLGFTLVSKFADDLVTGVASVSTHRANIKISLQFRAEKKKRRRKQAKLAGVAVLHPEKPDF
jgi:hypothetical protein